MKGGGKVTNLFSDGFYSSFLGGRVRCEVFVFSVYYSTLLFNDLYVFERKNVSKIRNQTLKIHTSTYNSVPSFPCKTRFVAKLVKSLVNPISVVIILKYFGHKNWVIRGLMLFWSQNSSYARRNVRYLKKKFPSNNLSLAW